MPETTTDKPLSLDLDVEVTATPERVFESLLDELGPSFRTPQNETMSMKLEARPGGRWFRDLGGGQGHFRSGERRGGEEGRSRWSPDHLKKKKKKNKSDGAQIDR